MAVQSRLRETYVGMYVYVCLWVTHTKKLYAKMRGRNLNVVVPRVSS